MKICVYDFDNTLTKENSLFGFVVFLITTQNSHRVLGLIKYIILRLEILFLSKIAKKSKTETLIKKLRGYHKLELTRLGKLYITESLKYNETIVNQLSDDRDNGYVPFIITATIEEIIAPSAEQLGGVKYYSSKLEYIDEICTGNLTEDIRGKKSNIVNKIIAHNDNVDLSMSKFVSDNIEDIPCARLFGNIVAVVVNAKGKTAWAPITHNIIDNRGFILKARHIYVLGYYYINIRTNWHTLIVYRFGFLALVVTMISAIGSIELMILSWLAFISLYEIGYIDNDFYAVKNEDNPSIRLATHQSELDIIKFILIRIIYFAGISLIMLIYFDPQTTALVLGLSVANLLIYFIHNRLPRKKRLISYTSLKASHFYIPLSGFAPMDQIIPAIVLFYLPRPIIAYTKKVGLVKIFNRKFLLVRLSSQVILICVLYYLNSNDVSITATIGCYFIFLEILEIKMKKKRVLQLFFTTHRKKLKKP